MTATKFSDGGELGAALRQTRAAALGEGGASGAWL
jgi:hypothetical protein